MSNYIAIRVDQDNNAEKWWANIREMYPNFAASLAKNDVAVIADDLWKLLVDVDGWFSGSIHNHVPEPLINCGNQGEMWSDVVGQKHQVFDELS